ncbi:MAG: RNase adapter RapZ [Psychrilyobacter sp.]|nr:RNase adapter RapZ [Psychrilyobacter sp.]
MEIIIITGMSGAGKSTALNFFEDRGFLTINNMPDFLIENIDFSSYKRSLKKMVMGLDVRSFENIDDFFKFIEKIKNEGITTKILYLDAKDEIILNRYNLTRRHHPLEEGNSITENISLERTKIQRIREIADILIDSSTLKPKELIDKLKSNFEKDKIRDLVFSITTFGFKYGAPTDLDMMFDVRCLPNPYYIDKLRVRSGNDLEVQEYVMNGSVSKEYLCKIKDMLDFLLPQFIKEGKTLLTVGIGCSGGKHRSVTIAKRLYEHMEKKENIKVTLDHKEKDKWAL